MKTPILLLILCLLSIASQIQGGYDINNSPIELWDSDLMVPSLTAAYIAGFVFKIDTSFAVSPQLQKAVCIDNRTTTVNSK
jgi:hypothetical protein